MSCLWRNDLVRSSRSPRRRRCVFGCVELFMANVLRGGGRLEYLLATSKAKREKAALPIPVKNTTKMSTQDQRVQVQSQELHLFPFPWGPNLSEGRASGPLRVGPGPLPLGGVWAEGVAAEVVVAPVRGVPVVEPFLNGANQLRLLATFPESPAAHVNGEPAPRRVVLAPGDLVQWHPGHSFRVALYNKPRIGPPSATVLGKPCPNCRVPFAADAVCFTCGSCGAVLHCEPAAEGLQCAQMRRECPVCRRPLLLTEGYINPPIDEG